MPVNPYTGTLNDPFSQAQHDYSGKDWERFFKSLEGKRVNMGGFGRAGGPTSLALLPAPGNEDVARTNAANLAIGDELDARVLRPANAPLDAVEAELRGLRDKQTVDRAMAIANDPRTSAQGRPILQGPNGSYATAPDAGGPVNRQAVAAQMAPGKIAPPPPDKPVTFGAPEKAMVNGKSVFVRAGSDGLTYDMGRRPIDPTVLQPPPDKNAPIPPVAAPLDSSGQPITGDALLKTFPAAKQKVLTAIIEGRQALPSGTALKDPYWKDLLESANLVDPSFDTVNYNARNKAYTDLSSPSGTGGKSINALNTAAQHISKLSDLVEKLDNFDIPMLNRVRNPVEREFGSTKVTNFDAVQPQAMKEIERLWRGAGGSAGEIDKLKESLGPNMGKQQQREALAEFADLMLGKLDATRSQRDSALGPIASKRVPVLFDQNKATLSKIFERAGKAAPDVLSVASNNGGKVSVTDPDDGVHDFATQAQADAFKKLAGIR